MTNPDAPLTETEKSILWTWCNCAHGEAENEIMEATGCRIDESLDRLVALSERAQRIYGQPFPRYSEAF